MILTAQKNVQGLKAPIAGPVRVRFTFEFAKNCPMDNDNMQAGIQDLLQSSGILENDKQIKLWSGEIRENTGRIDQTLVEIEKIGAKEAPSDALSVIKSIVSK